MQFLVRKLLPTTCTIHLLLLPAESVADPGWHAVLDLVKTVSESISSSLHSFWAISKSLIDGKLKRVSRIWCLEMTGLEIYDNFQPITSTRSPSQCQAMALSIVRHYISVISQTFMLSDVIIMTSPSFDSANSRPPLLPVISHSLSTAHHLQKILAEVQDCVNEINSLNISTDVNQGLKNLLESVQWKFLDVLARDWLKGRRFPYIFIVSIFTDVSPQTRTYFITSNPGLSNQKNRLRHLFLSDSSTFRDTYQLLPIKSLLLLNRVLPLRRSPREAYKISRSREKNPELCLSCLSIN